MLQYIDVFYDCIDTFFVFLITFRNYFFVGKYFLNKIQNAEAHYGACLLRFWSLQICNHQLNEASATIKVIQRHKHVA